MMENKFQRTLVKFIIIGVIYSKHNMNSQSFPFNVQLLLNAPYHLHQIRKRAEDYRPRNKKDRIRQHTDKTPASNKQIDPHTPLLNKSKKLLRDNVNCKVVQSQFNDRCFFHLSKKEEATLKREEHKQEELNTMFKNIKEALKQNEKHQKTAQKSKGERDDISKQGFLVMRSQMHEQYYKSQDKLQFLRISRASNQLSHRYIKNAVNHINANRYILNPFLANNTVECRSAILSEQKKQKEKQQSIQNAIMTRSKKSSSQRKKTVAVLKPEFQRSMSFHMGGESDCTYQKKIKHYLEFIFKVNYSNMIYVDLALTKADDIGRIPKYKVYIGRGNNSLLVKSIIKRRFWWQVTHNINESDIDFYWSQNTIDKVQSCQKAVGKLEKGIKTQRRGESSSSRRKGLQEVYELNRKILNSEQALNVEKYIANQRFGIPFETQFQPDIITNHIHNNHCIGSKKNLFKSLLHYHRNITKKDPFQFIPKTYHIRSLQDPEYLTFLAENSHEPSKIWIIKPGEHTNRGKSISLGALKDMDKYLSKTKHSNGQQLTYIVQSYLNKPLLYNFRKFDIRHFMLLSSINGNIKAYWYKDGYIRTSSFLFQLENTENLYIHLTNDAIQKKSDQYEKYEPANKVSYGQFQRYLQFGFKDKGYRFEDVLQKMKAIAVDIVKANYQILDPQRRKNSFQIIGLDFMIDREFRPWLIEANYNPCLEVNCLVLERIIPALIENSLRLALDPLYPPPCHYPPSKRFYLADNHLKHLKYELIFDQTDLKQPIVNDYPFEDDRNEEEEFADDGKEVQDIQV